AASRAAAARASGRLGFSRSERARRARCHSPAGLSLLYQHFFRLISNYWKFKRLIGIIDVGEEKGRPGQWHKRCWGVIASWGSWAGVLWGWFTARSISSSSARLR